MRGRNIAIAAFIIAAVAAVAFRLGGGGSRSLKAPSLVTNIEGAPAAHPALAATDPAVLVAAEARGLSLGAVLGAVTPEAREGRESQLSNDRLLAASPAYRAVVETLRGDLRELNARPKIGEGPDFGNHPFRDRWLADAHTRFELIGAIHRLDRKTGEASRACGEIRLVYRLAADPPSRPTTRLPMTLNVLFGQPMPESGGCAALAKRWADLPGRGEGRVLGLLAIFGGAHFDQIETNLQNVHGPSLREDMDDHAEYVLRAFDADAKGASPRRLFNTPRADLDAAGKARVLAFMRDHFDEIDEGTWVFPSDLCAERIVSVTPRGLERPGNRSFDDLAADPAFAQELAALPYARAKQARTPAALLRRLDEGTCAGCHQTRAIAGFHLLGEERVRTPFNALQTAGSPHFHEDLRWRQ
jgi:hypothetical protein